MKKNIYNYYYMKIRGIKQKFIELLPEDINICLLGLQGSRMLGLAQNNDADYDYRGIYIANRDEVISLNKPKEQYEYCDSRDGEIDYVIYEIEKFIRLCLKGNPSILHLLFVPKYNVKDNVGDFLIKNKNVFLGEKQIRASFAGYALSQILYLKRNHKFQGRQKKEKHIRHCFILFDTGQELLETGKITLPLKNPEKYIEISKIENEDKLIKMFEKRDKEFKKCKSCLSLEPNFYLANQILISIRNDEV